MYDHFTLDQLKTFTFTVSAILLVAQLYYLAVLGCIENKISKVFETRANAFTIEHKKLKDHIKMQQMLNLKTRYWCPGRPPMTPFMSASPR